MDWMLVIKIIATVVLVAITGGLIYIMRDTVTSYHDDPGTGY